MIDENKIIKDESMMRIMARKYVSQLKFNKLLLLKKLIKQYKKNTKLQLKKELDEMAAKYKNRLWAYRKYYNLFIMVDDINLCDLLYDE